MSGTFALTPEGRSKAQDMAQALFDAVASVWGSLTETTVAVCDAEAVWRTAPGSGPPYDGPLFCTRGSVEGEQTGTVLFLFSQKEMITLAGLMVKAPERDIGLKRVKPEFVALDLDASKELCNQMCGAAATGLRALIKKDVSVVQLNSWTLGSAAAARASDMAFLAPPFLELRATLGIHSYAPAPIVLQVPPPVAEMWLKAAKCEVPLREVVGKALLIFPPREATAGLGSLLEGAGVSWRPVHSLAAALRALGEDRPGVILIHTRLEEPQPVKLVELLRNDPRSRGIPLIGCGPVADKQQVVQILQSGAVDFLLPPHSPEQIQARVLKHLS